MNIRCPHCDSTLTDIRPDKEKNTLSCPHCGKNILTKELLTHNIEIFSRLKLSSRIPGDFRQLGEILKTPPDKRIEIEMPERDQMHIYLRGPYFSGGCFFLVFALFWNSAMVAPVTAILASGKIQIWWGMLLLLFLALLVCPVGLALLTGAMFYLFGITEVIIDPKNFQIRKSIFKLGWSRKIKTAAIEEVTFGGSAVSVRATSKRLDFASGLSYRNNTWLILILQYYLQILLSENSEKSN